MFLDYIARNAEQDKQNLTFYGHVYVLTDTQASWEYAVHHYYHVVSSQPEDLMYIGDDGATSITTLLGRTTSVELRKTYDLARLGLRDRIKKTGEGLLSLAALMNPTHVFAIGEQYVELAKAELDEWAPAAPRWPDASAPQAAPPPPAESPARRQFRE
eukprot:TRINITY_DN22973_c0_g1_i1.p4 TRINITY_DN22973_c0_g1~~TRINITY_DN22973_c0_g1_i1.p4  ORF type:complete len:158 (-),score=44.54 TRINITY_DN22973_c0_g1_i1:470-943(-)